MTRQEFLDLVEQTLRHDLAHPEPGLHAQRWKRIIEIDTYLKSVAAQNIFNRGTRRHSDPKSTPYDDTPEWNALVQEGTLLEEVERDHAMNAAWPIWQAGQHFKYVDDSGIFREGEVISFDLDAKTIACSTLPLYDFAGSINREGSRIVETISVQQILDAIRREEEMEAVQQTAAIQRAVAEERERIQRLPLFVGLSTESRTFDPV